jgi:hypothetical protein
MNVFEKEEWNKNIPLNQVFFGTIFRMVGNHLIHFLATTMRRKCFKISCSAYQILGIISFDLRLYTSIPIMSSIYEYIKIQRDDASLAALKKLTNKLLKDAL